MQSKKIVFRLLILLQVGFFCHYYVFGKHGLLVQDLLQNQMTRAAQEIYDLQHAITSLETAFFDWHSDSFSQEQFARERLGYAYPTDEIFF